MLFFFNICIHCPGLWRKRRTWLMPTSAVSKSGQRRWLTSPRVSNPSSWNSSKVYRSGCSVRSGFTLFVHFSWQAILMFWMAAMAAVGREVRRGWTNQINFWEFYFQKENLMGIWHKIGAQMCQSDTEFREYFGVFSCSDWLGLSFCS